MVIDRCLQENLRIWLRIRPKAEKQEPLKPMQFKREQPGLTIHINKSTSSWSDIQGQPEKTLTASIEKVHIGDQDHSDLESGEHR